MKVAEISIDEDVKIIPLVEHTFSTGNTGFEGRGIIDAKGEGYTIYIRLAKFRKKETSGYPSERVIEEINEARAREEKE